MDELPGPTNIIMHGHVGVAEYGGGDRNTVAMFYMKPNHNPAKSAELGRPYYDEMVYVKIHPPGERLNIVDRPMREEDKRRFPNQWNQFAQHREQRPDGTPIDLLYPDHPSIGATLRANGVYTVEQCAELSANAIESVGMGSQRWVNYAQKFLESANKGMHASQIRRELDERDGQIRVLTQQIETMRGEMDRLRTQVGAGTNLQDVQNLLAGMMARPQYPPPAPGARPPRGFDPASAQIAANHATADITRQQVARAKQNAPAAPARRPRAKLA